MQSTALVFPDVIFETIIRYVPVPKFSTWEESINRFSLTCKTGYKIGEKLKEIIPLGIKIHSEDQFFVLVQAIAKYRLKEVKIYFSDAIPVRFVWGAIKMDAVQVVVIERIKSFVPTGSHFLIPNQIKKLIRGNWCILFSPCLELLDNPYQRWDERARVHRAFLVDEEFRDVWKSYQRRKDFLIRQIQNLKESSDEKMQSSISLYLTGWDFWNYF